MKMFEFLKIGRKQQDRGSGSAVEAHSQPASSVPQSIKQHTATQRELVRVVLRDTLRLNGIPPEWVGCETLMRSRKTGDVVLLIQLLIHQWHEGLLHYAPLIQQQLLQALQHFDPATDHSQHTVVWKFSPACKCPHTAMPDPSYWAEATTQQPTPPQAAPCPGLDGNKLGLTAPATGTWR